MNLKISSHTLQKLIMRLNSGVGHDSIHTVFLKHASLSFLENIAHFLNSCFVHCYLPGDLLKGTITPILKDSRKKFTESDNYRPVMQSSCLLKIFELFILDVLSEKLVLNYRQLGYKAGVSTTDTCFILKEIMRKYTNSKKRALATFVDLSKAFDMVDHFILGTKLLELSVPVDIILILMHYLRNQKANVKWQDSYSNYVYIATGVRQGGIISPFLFKLYMDAILRDVARIEAGCKYGDMRWNIY